MEEKNNLKLEIKENKAQPKKFSYEELEGIATQLSEQLNAAVRENQQLRKQVQGLTMTNVYTELNFKFEVVKNAHMFSPEFADRIVQEIEDIMTPEKEETPDKEEASDKDLEDNKEE